MTVEYSNKLNRAITALQLAAQCGGELDQAEYSQAAVDLEHLRDQIVAEDVRKSAATLFMQELLDSVENLTSIAEVHGARTLADIVYLQAAILNNGFIDHYPNESAVMTIANSLPSGERWAKFIKLET
jgi:hypothetical protein